MRIAKLPFPYDDPIVKPIRRPWLQPPKNTPHLQLELPLAMLNVPQQGKS